MPTKWHILKKIERKTTFFFTEHKIDVKIKLVVIFPLCGYDLLIHLTDKVDNYLFIL